MPELVQALVTAVKLIVTGDPDVYQITARTLEISLSSALIASAIFIPLGSLIYFRRFAGKGAVINIIQTLYSLPTTFVGLLVFITFSRAGPLGSLGILFTPASMVIGQVILVAPLIAGLTISALKGVGEGVRDTAASLGASEFQIAGTMMREVRYALVTGVLMGFGRAVSEVGVAVMVGGNIRGFTRTLTTAMALETSMGNTELSMALGIILISLALIVSILAHRFQQR